MKSKRTKSSRKYFLICMLVLAAAILAIGGLKIYNDHKTTPEPSTTGASGVNYAPPTEEDKKEVDQHKADLGDQQSSTGQSSNSQKKSVTPVITSADSSAIKAYVPGVFEDGGICTATLTKGSTTLTKSSTGFKNVSYTTCPPMKLASGELSAGTWSVVVSYSSDAAQGTSTSSTIEVK